MVETCSWPSARREGRARLLCRLPVCVWEAAIKSALGELRVPDDLPERLDEFAFERLPVTDAHAWAVRALPPVHHDPFDRLLVAQALCERATVVSADAVFDAYAVARIWE